MATETSPPTESVEASDQPIVIEPLEKVVAQMRQYIHHGDDGHECRVSGHTITSWANTIEQAIRR